MKKITTLLLLIFLACYTVQAQSFKPEQFEGSWEADCEGCSDELSFTFTTKQEISFIRNDRYDERISWDIVGNNVLFFVTETPEREVSNILIIKSVTADEIKLATPVIKFGSPSPPEKMLILHKRKKGKFNFKPSEAPKEEPKKPE